MSNTLSPRWPVILMTVLSPNVLRPQVDRLTYLFRHQNKFFCPVHCETSFGNTKQFPLSGPLMIFDTFCRFSTGVFFEMTHLVAIEKNARCAM